jgi:hypothetical protein
VLEGIGWSDTSLWGFLKHLLDDVFRLFRESSESKVVHIWLFLFDLVKGSLSILALERKLSTNKGVENDSCRPHVDLLPIPFSMKHLRSHICWCSTALNHFFIRHQNFGKPKVRYLDLNDFFGPRIFLNKNVLRLEVPVHHSTSLHVLDGLNKLIHDDSYLSLL